MKEFEQAILCFDQIIALDKNNISAWFNLAIAYQDKAAYTLYENEELEYNINEMMKQSEVTKSVPLQIQVQVVDDTVKNKDKIKEKENQNNKNRNKKDRKSKSKSEPIVSVSVSQQLLILSREKLLVVLTDFQMALKSYETVLTISSNSKSKMKTFMFRDAKIASNFIKNKLCEFHSTSNSSADNNSDSTSDNDNMKAEPDTITTNNVCDENKVISTTGNSNRNLNYITSNRKEML